jgi:hypothetical protein
MQPVSRHLCAARNNCVARASFPVLLCALAGACLGGELRVSTDFEGGSASVQSIDQEKRVIRVMPGGDPQRGWPCWWYLRVDGMTQGERIAIDLGGSDRPARNNGQDTGKPLPSHWAMPMRASFSTDDVTWQHTAPGKRDGGRVRYEIIGTGEPIWIAWGPPFTPADTDALISRAEAQTKAATAFELTKTRDGRMVRALRISTAPGKARHGVWLQARQHAWESGASWVARGFAEWITGDDPDARWLRDNAETVLVPIMDVDNVATGNGGKEAAPRDHNRDWSAEPMYPEIAAAQRHLRQWTNAGRLDVYLDLHNPGSTDMQPFFFVGPEQLLDEVGRGNRAEFLESARRMITGPLVLEEKPRMTGPGYHPLWRQMSGAWVNTAASPRAVAVCLETAWNTPHSTTDGYLGVGRQAGKAIVGYLRGKAAPAGAN